MAYPHFNGRLDRSPPPRRFRSAPVGFETVRAPERIKIVALRCRQAGYPQLTFNALYHGIIETSHVAVCLDPKAGLVEKFPLSVFAPCNPAHWPRWPSYLRPLTPVQAAN